MKKITQAVCTLIAMLAILLLFILLILITSCSKPAPQQINETQVDGECLYRMATSDVPTLCKYNYQCETACRDICQKTGLYYKRQSYKSVPSRTQDSLCRCTCTDAMTPDSRVIGTFKAEDYISENGKPGSSS